MTSITYIIGTRDAGKTSLIKEAIKLIPNSLGVYAEKCFDNEGNVKGYDAVLIPTGERLAHCRRYQDQHFTQPHGGFWFDESVFTRVHEHIMENFDPRVSQTVIIDEIGNLEMKHHRGYYPTLEALIQAPDLHLILALRG